MEHNRIVYEKLYDSEVEYLESTGTQWVNTEYKPNTNTRTVGRCYFNSFIGSKANYVFGVFTRPNNYGFNVGVARQFFNVPWGSNDGINLTGLIPQTNEDYEFDISKTGYKVNGTSYATPSTELVNSTRNMYLFWSNGTSAVGMNGRIYYCKIYNGNTLVRDFIPVRKGSIGYLYDKVSKRLFGNKGTGNFILGQDVANPVPNIRRVFRFGNKRFVMPMPYDSRVEYLESTGTQYIYIPFTLNKGDNAYCSVCVTETELHNSNIIFMSSMNSKNKYGCVFLNRRIWFSSFSNNGVTGKNIYYDYNVWRNISIIYNASRNEYTFNVDNTNLASQTPAYNSASEIYLFCRNNLLEDAAKERISSLKIKRNGNYILDLIPVRRGNVGYMYDRVSCRLFGNSGTGNFILGNDIND